VCFLYAVDFSFWLTFCLEAPPVKALSSLRKSGGRAPVKYDSDDGEPVSGFEDDSPKQHKNGDRVGCFQSRVAATGRRPAAPVKQMITKVSGRAIRLNAPI